MLLATSLPSNSRQVMPSLGSPTRYFFADSYPQCGAGGRCGCECLWSPDLFSLARHGAGPYGWARLHRGSQVPAGKLLGNKHLQLWLRLAGPWDHGRPLCGAVLASQLASKPLRLDGAFVRMWGASRRTRSSLLRHKGESVQGCWGVTEPADRDVAGSPRTAGTRDGSVVGAQEVPALLSLLFPNICFILICRPPSSSPNPTSTPHGRM